MSVQATSQFPTKRLKHVVSLRRSRVDGIEDGRPYVGLENIDSWTGALLGDFATSNNLEGTSQSNTFEPGDVLFGKLRPYLAKVWVAEFAGRSTTECLVMKPVEVESRFLGYVCVSPDFVDAVDASTFGSKMPRADWDFIGNMSVPVPEWRKQLTIADYLDRETARLDALMAVKERMLALLLEKRQALITKTVTRDCDSTEPQTPPDCSTLPTEESQNEYKVDQSRDHAPPVGGDGVSFLSWTVDLPENWEAMSLRSVAHYVVSNVDKVTHVGEFPVRLCNYVDVYHREFITLEIDFMHATASEAEIENFGLRVDDVLITKDSESWDDIGVPALVRQTSEDLVCGYHLALIRVFPHKMTGAFLFRCIQAKPVQVQLELAANGVTRFGIPKSGIGMLKLPVPPLPRQRAITEYLNRETARFDALMAEIKDTITLLKERRAVLIAAVVTGQFDIGEAE